MIRKTAGYYRLPWPVPSSVGLRVLFVIGASFLGVTASSTLNKNNTHYSQKKWLETQFFLKGKNPHQNLKIHVTR